MKPIIFSLLLVPTLILSAQTATTTTDTPVAIEATQAVVTSSAVANISLLNLTATKSGTTTYSINFSLINEGETPATIYYTASLVDKNGTVISTQTFNKPQTLQKRTPALISEQVTFPKALTGTYTIRVQAFTDKGLPVGFGIAENIVLKDTELVKLSSCEPDQKSYKANQVLTLACSITETKKGALTTTNSPGYIVKSSIFYNNEPIEVQSVTGEIDKNKASLSVNNLTLPGTYTIRTSLFERTGAPVGKEVQTLFTVQGTIATILNALLDKVVYEQGEDAVITVALSIKTEGTSSPLSLATTLVGKDGECSASPVQPIENVSSLEISLPVIKKCTDPTLTVRIIDAETKVLAEKTVSLKSPVPTEQTLNMGNPPEPKLNIPLIGGVAGAIVLLLALGEVFVFRKMRQGTTPSATPVVPTPTPQTTPVSAPVEVTPTAPATVAPSTETAPTPQVAPEPVTQTPAPVITQSVSDVVTQPVKAIDTMPEAPIPTTTSSAPSA
jgi:hypothetical protein